MAEKGYKAFRKGMICMDKQYEENTTYEESGNEVCERGVMHYCENPFDVLDYYPLIDGNGKMTEFAEVEPLGEVYRGENKCATNKLHIGAKLGFKGFIKACVDFTLEKTKLEKIEDSEENDNGNDYAQIGSSGYWAQIGSSGYGAQIGSSGYGAQIGSSGNYAQIGSSGDYAKIGSSGYGAQIGSSGDYAKIGSSGYGAQIGSSGYGAQIGSSGDCAKIGSSGNYAQIGSSGDYAKIGSSGYGAQITSEGKNSVVMAAGYNPMAKAKVGSWITLAEWVRTDDEDEKGNCIWIPKCVKTEYVDGERIKEDTFYKLVDGEFTEAE